MMRRILAGFYRLPQSRLIILAQQGVCANVVQVESNKVLLCDSLVRHLSSSLDRTGKKGASQRSPSSERAKPITLRLAIADIGDEVARRHVLVRHAPCRP